MVARVAARVVGRMASRVSRVGLRSSMMRIPLSHWKHQHCHVARPSGSSPPSTPWAMPSSFAAYPRRFSSGAGTSSKVVVVEDDQQFSKLLKEVEGDKSLAVVYYTARWCGPCKQISPFIDELSQQFEDVKFLKVDVDTLELEETMKSAHIGVVPTFHFHKGGKLVGELTGAVKDKLKNLVSSLRSKAQP